MPQSLFDMAGHALQVEQQLSEARAWFGGNLDLVQAQDIPSESPIPAAGIPGLKFQIGRAHV